MPFERSVYDVKGIESERLRTLFWALLPRKLQDATSPHHKPETPFRQDPMASDPKRREKLVPEILAVRKLLNDSMADARFGGWTREQKAAYDERAEHLRRLVRELENLDAGDKG